MRALRLRSTLALALALTGVAACGSGSSGGNTGGSSGGPGAAGAGGGSGGTSTAGTGGTSGEAGTTGAGATAGSSAAGAAGDGSGGTGTGAGGTGAGGSGGSAGSASPGGRGGATGTAGSAGGRGGATGTAGSAGGRGGTGVAGTGVVGGSGGQTSCPGEAYDPASPPQTLTLSGSLGAHDPAALVVGNTIYLFATGLTAKTSTNLTSWQNATSPLNPRPAWVADKVPGATNLWAPDVSYFGGTYHLYYAASTFGSNKSCIGHATRAALDTGTWLDEGSTICSNMGSNDDWNAIDPNVIVDEAGTPWLAFGSFWGGLKMIQLDPATGARAGTTVYAIAARAQNAGALEAPWVFERCGFYYLFSSWDSCCGDPYDYNIRVGRSATVTGPYVDRSGVALMKGGGTLVVAGDATWIAPGHNAVITYGNKTYNVYHALTARGMTATLRVSELAWSDDGWPVSGGP